ncbi:MAG: tetratricopeptide repeat protein [Candidatus Sulfotelmatobacter sp.]
MFLRPYNSKFFLLGSRWLATLLLVAVLPLSAQEKAKLPSLHGTVRDAHGSRVVGASVSLHGKNSTGDKSAVTDAVGSYTFIGLAEGVYSLYATKSGYGDAELASVFVGAQETKTLDIVLSPPAAMSPQFFDQPQFTVSGVTDTTSLGGHGSDTVVRTRDSIAKDTARLNKSEINSSAVSPEIERSLQAGNYVQARDDLRNLLAHQDKPEVHHLLADVDEKLGNSLEAVHEYQRAAEIDPREPYIFDWGSELLLHHAPEPAEAVFTRGAKLYPQSVRMLIGLGASSFARGANDQAVQQICAASDLNPNDPAPYLFLGKMLHAEKISSDEVVHRLQRFAKLQPQNAEAHYSYAVALWKHRDPQDHARVSQVESELADAIRLDPDFAAAELQLGIVHADQTNYAGAIPHYERAIQIAPQTEEAHFRLAQAYRQTAQPEKAKTELRAYEQLSKESAQELEQERHEIRQFVYTLRDQPPPEVLKP